MADGTPLARWFCSGFLHTLQDGRLLNVCHHQGNLEVSYSSDAGGTWTGPQVIRSPDADVKFGMESYSKDGGLSWTKPKQSSISCSGPVYMTRLPTNGRIAMVWNEADWTQAEKWAGWPNGFANASIALSGDDGKTWRKPVVYARGGKRTVHSMVVEYAPGKLLINMMERSVLLVEGDTIGIADLPGLRNPVNSALEDLDDLGLKEYVRVHTAKLERARIQRVLEAEDGNVTRAARRLGISRKSLQTKMKDYGLRDEP